MPTSRQIFDLTVLNNNHPEIRALRKEHGYPTHHGNKLWKSSLLLMDYLQQYPITLGCRVLEIGCGWGLTGIYCAQQFNAKVTCLDIDQTVFPYVELHAAINNVKVETLCKPYEALSGKLLQEYDVILGGDICFWDHLSPLLYNLTRRSHKNNVRTIITDPGRPPFTEMAEKAADKLQGVLKPWFVAPPYNTRGYVLDVPPASLLETIDV